MEVILSDREKTFTGSLGAGFGYSIRRRGKRFFAVRSPKGNVPLDGHWRSIKACAELAFQELYVVDILVTAKELRAALDEAGKIFYPDRLVIAPKDEIWHASQVMRLVNNIGL